MSTSLNPKAAACTLTLLLASALPLGASATLINFDDVANGTVINSFYSAQGVIFRNPLGASTSNSFSPDIFARSSSVNASAPNVVSVFGTGAPAFDARYGAVEAVFSTAQRTVSIDAAIVRLPEGLGTPLNSPKIEIYDTSNNFITAVSWNFAQIAQPPVGGVTGFETLSYTSTSLNIGKVRLLSGQPGNSPSNFGIFDNLNFTTAVPEPSSYALFGLGLAGISASMWRRRRYF